MSAGTTLPPETSSAAAFVVIARPGEAATSTTALERNETRVDRDESVTRRP
jgi:hypothetical protein